MAEGSQTFEEDLARLILSGQIDRKEGLANADSPTNLMWRLQNVTESAARESVAPLTTASAPSAPEVPEAVFSHIVLDAPAAKN